MNNLKSITGQNQGDGSAQNTRTMPFGITEQQYNEGVSLQFFQESIESIRRTFPNINLYGFELTWEKDVPHEDPDNPRNTHKDRYTAFFYIQVKE